MANNKEGEAAVYERKVENRADEYESETGAIRRDEEISACFDRAKKNLNGLLKSKRQVIRDLACELQRLGRPVDHIAAEIVHELRNCEELSRSQIYSYLDDKYKNQTQAQRRKGKKDSNPDPKTGTESRSPEQGRTEQTSNTNTNASEPISITASPTSLESTGEDSMFPGPSNKSPVCEFCSVKDNWIKKLGDENRKMGVLCSLAESSNNELVLQLTAREKEIEKLLEEQHDMSDLPDQYVRQECLSCRESDT